MITAALISFAVLLLAWLVAPAGAPPEARSLNADPAPAVADAA